MFRGCGWGLEFRGLELQKESGLDLSSRQGMFPATRRLRKCALSTTLPYHALTIAGEPYEADPKPQSSAEANLWEGGGGLGWPSLAGIARVSELPLSAFPFGDRASASFARWVQVSGLEVFGLGLGNLRFRV